MILSLGAGLLAAIMAGRGAGSAVFVGTLVLLGAIALVERRRAANREAGSPLT